MRNLVVGMLMVLVAVPVMAYHEFRVPKKAFKKVTIEYFSNDTQKTVPDSTVWIYYDKNDVELYREVKEGCGNVIWQDDSLSYQDSYGYNILVNAWAIDTSDFKGE